ncbi:transposase [Mesorhizobium koreense]|uniref:transposase n=1 Tax=Mesorhizobium koreense TaxID=3074855 RepID=UPI00287B905C|nr:transposase [Mesorhizobium sp. WR6]
MTPSRYQSGEIDRDSGVSKCGDAGIQWVLVEAAGILLRLTKRSSPLKAWDLSIAHRRGMMKATSWRWRDA